MNFDHPASIPPAASQKVLLPAIVQRAEGLFWRGEAGAHWRYIGPVEHSVFREYAARQAIRIELVATIIFVILVSFWVVPAMRCGFIQYQAIIALFYRWLSILASLGIGIPSKLKFRQQCSCLVLKETYIVAKEFGQTFFCVTKHIMEFDIYIYIYYII